MRRICFYVVVISMTLLAIITIANSVFSKYGVRANWTFYTPYSNSIPIRSYTDVYFEWSDVAMKILLPIAALSLTAYLFALERQIRNLNIAHGFPVKIAGDE